MLERVRTYSILPSICFFLLLSSSQAADYWPIEDRIVWNYGSPEGSAYNVLMVVYEGGFLLSEPNPFLFTTSRFQENGDGDIEAVSWFDGHEHGFYSAQFDPPLLFLDFPLEVGKVWETVNASGGLRGEVLREEDVTVPAGTFRVKVVRISNIQNGGLFVGDYYLDRDVGNIIHNGAGLNYISGIVAVETSSWGSLKALFR